MNDDEAIIDELDYDIFGPTNAFEERVNNLLILGKFLMNFCKVKELEQPLKVAVIKLTAYQSGLSELDMYHFRNLDAIVKHETFALIFDTLTFKVKETGFIDE